MAKSATSNKVLLKTFFFPTLKQLLGFLIRVHLLPSVNKLTDVPPRRKRNDNTAFAIFVYMVPTVNPQVGGGGRPRRI